jgi:hypothetical protein
VSRLDAAEDNPSIGTLVELSRKLDLTMTITVAPGSPRIRQSGQGQSRMTNLGTQAGRLLRWASAAGAAEHGD